LVLWAVTRLFGVGRIASGRVALLLAQSGEFGFVLFGAALHAGLFDSTIYQEAILVVALSMVVTPLLATRLNRGRGEGEMDDELSELDPSMHITAMEDEQPAVIVAGFGRMGQRISNLLQDAGVSYVAIEQRPTLVAKGRQRGYSVYYGNAAQSDVLESAGVSEAKMMVVAVDNADVVEFLVDEVHRLYPSLPIFARGHSHSRCEHLLHIGATAVASENLEASLQLARFALKASGVDEEQVELLLEEYRGNYYVSLDQRD
jgi:voltage-gated potassium channel Kch